MYCLRVFIVDYKNYIFYYNTHSLLCSLKSICIFVIAATVSYIFIYVPIIVYGLRFCFTRTILLIGFYDIVALNLPVPEVAKCIAYRFL